MLNGYIGCLGGNLPCCIWVECVKGWVGPWQSHHDCSGCEVDGAMLILRECELIIVFSAAVIIDRFLLLVIIIVDTGHCQLTQLGVLAHSIGTHGKVFHGAAANEFQVVMDSS